MTSHQRQDPMSSARHGFTTASVAGFTLIELLVVIGIIGLLLGILLPSLGGAKSSANQTKSLTNLRSIGTVFALYTDAYRSHYPFYVAGEETHASPPDEGSHTTLSFSPHWDLSRHWPNLMHDIAPWREHYLTWLSPGTEYDPARPWMQANDGNPTSYMYSESFLGRPHIWTDAGDADENMIAPTRDHEISHPSSKVLLYDAARAYLRTLPDSSDQRPLLFADGSTSLRYDAEARPPVQNRLRTDPPRLYHDTSRGILGVDF